jgi:2-oxoglutarate ferredoxin oxidoreductase subunit alpha
MRIRAFPFNDDVEVFIEKHDMVFVVEQNRDSQMRSLLMAEFEFGHDKIKSVLSFDGDPISARNIRKQILKKLPGDNVTPIRGNAKETV